MTGEWQPIETAPQRVKDVASVLKAEAGRYRMRLAQLVEFVDGHHVLKTYALWTGFAAGSPVTHWLSEPLPVPPL